MNSRVDFSQNDFDRLRLIRSANIGPVSYQHLLRRFGNAADALQGLPDLAARGGGRAPKIADQSAIEKELADVRNLGANLLFLGDADFPGLLSELSDAPPVITWRGDLEILQRPAIAMVGARNASAAACRFARELANSLNQSGIAVVSGLARGIDTAAHQGSIANGTIGVIAGGIDIYYPPENMALQDDIATRGLLMAEQPVGTEPRARHFPFRNRIIAGLARGTVVVEAAPRSGSLITARLANENGRHVMAVPGSPLDPRSMGCNNLIREGATLVQSADDIIELIQHFDDRAETGNQKYDFFHPSGNNNELKENGSTEVDDADRQSLFDLLGMTAVSVDELVRQSGLPPASVQLILLELELAERLERHAGAKVSLR